MFRLDTGAVGAELVVFNAAVMMFEVVDVVAVGYVATKVCTPVE